MIDMTDGPVLVTGMPGTGVRRALAKFQQRHAEYEAVYVDDHLPSVVSDAARAMGIWDHSSVIDPVEAFALPEAVLRDGWPAALTEAMRSKPRGPNVLLSMHAAWYHRDTTGLVNAASVDALRDYAPRLLVTLIDDIYDVVARLSRPHGVFEPRHGGSKDRYVRRLLKALAWREAEFRASQVLAQALDIPHALLPVKHPLGTLARVIRLPQDRWVYVSHPIPAAIVQPDIPRLVDRVAQGLEGEGFVCFLPATIDERRFEFDNGIPLGRLRERWPHGAPNALLWDELEGAERAEAAQPFEDASRWDVGTPESWRLLLAEIDEQIRWRDRQLVTQSRRLIALRPFASPDGRIAGGVEAEGRLHVRLASYRSEQPHVVVHHPDSDEARRRVRAVVAVLSSAAQAGHITGSWDETTIAATEHHAGLLHEDQWATATQTELRHLVRGLIGDIAQTSGATLSVRGRQEPGVMRGGAADLAAQRMLREIGADIARALSGSGVWDQDPYALSVYAHSERVPAPHDDAEAVIAHAIRAWRQDNQ